MTTIEPLRVSIAPSPDVILAELERENMTWAKALAEVIDNALDADATRIVITIDRAKKSVQIEDNGTGCAEPHRMLVSGYSTRRGHRSALGRYGVGLKHASYYLAGRNGRTEIVTSCDGQHRHVRVCWNDVVKSGGGWWIDAPDEITATAAKECVRDGRGTCIRFLSMDRAFMSAPQLVAAIDKLSFIFSPALRAGRQIEMHVGPKASVLAPPKEPTWMESVAFTVDVDGRRASIRAGILAPNDKSGRRGICYAFGHRIIMEDSGLGCGDYSTIGFSGYADLENVTLGQNKSQITDSLSEELYEQILDGCRHLLEKLKVTMRELSSDAIRNHLSQILGQTLGLTSGKPKRPGRRGTRRGNPRSRVDRTIRNATEVGGDGDARGCRRRGGSLSIDWVDDAAIAWAARVDKGDGRIYLNRANPGVASALHSSDMRTLSLLAAVTWFRHSEEGTALFGKQSFEEMVGEFMSKPFTLDVAANPVITP